MKICSFRLAVAIVFFTACNTKPIANKKEIVSPVLATQKVKHDSDDPAIWINPKDSSDVIVIGTDKGGELGDGGLYAFDLSGKIIDSVRPLKRPNNVDIAYGFQLNDTLVDIAVCTERLTDKIRVFRLPDLEPIDNGGISVFEGEDDEFRDPMGIALYTNPVDRKVYAIVGRKTGPKDGTYLWQYLLTNEKGVATGKLVRKFGFYSGRKEIESIAVDSENGFVYHSDEKYGIHKSYAHPDSSNIEIALFGTTGFTEDVEGISIYKTGEQSGYILVSDQQASIFRVFPREGTKGKPHEHPELAAIPFDIVESDGSDVTNRNIPGFPNGLFVAMTDNGTFQYYRWEDVLQYIEKK